MEGLSRFRTIVETPNFSHDAFAHLAKKSASSMNVVPGGKRTTVRSALCAAVVAEGEGPGTSARVVEGAGAIATGAGMRLAGAEMWLASDGADEETLDEADVSEAVIEAMT